MVVVLLTVLAVAVGYYLWLARHVAPRLVSLLVRLAIAVMALWIALPWMAQAAVVSLVCG